jgi:hypothetical protein
MKITRPKNPTSTAGAEELAVTLGRLLTRLAKEIAARGGNLPVGMLDDLQAISLEGIDPMWQLEQLQAIMDRWLKAH